MHDTHSDMDFIIPCNDKMDFPGIKIPVTVVETSNIQQISALSCYSNATEVIQLESPIRALVCE